VSEENYRWYIIRTASSCEKRVAQTIKEQAVKHGLSDYFAEIVVPVERITEIRKGQKLSTEHKFLSSYILIKMQMNDLSWHLVRNVPKVSGFLGANSKPQPISEAEAQRILSQMEEGVAKTKSGSMFEVGESVKIIDGPFESFVGVVEDLDMEKHRLKVSVSIFDRATPLELEYSQVTKID
jgi:transcriptional antiterminator NusG